MLKVKSDGMTLNEVLGILGMAAEKPCPSIRCVPGSRSVFEGSDLLFTGAAHEVWEWLCTSRRIEVTCGQGEDQETQRQATGGAV